MPFHHIFYSALDILIIKGKLVVEQISGIRCPCNNSFVNNVNKATLNALLPFNHVQMFIYRQMFINA
jgi:hypothetical protein